MTCLVHGHAAESQSVGVRREHHCCGRVIEIPDFLFQTAAGARVRTDPSGIPVLIDTPLSDAEITTDQHGRSGTSGGTRSFFLHVRSSDKCMYVTSKKKRMNVHTPPHEEDPRHLLDPERLHDGPRSASLHQEAVNHCDAEIPGQSNRWNTLRDHGTVGFDDFDQRKRALLYKLELSKSCLTTPPCCECPHSFLLQRFFQPSIVPKLTVRTSPLVVARFRRWFRCPLLCQRAGFNLAQPLAPTSRDPLNP